MGRKKSEKVIFDIRIRADSEFHERIKKAAARSGNPVAAFIRSIVSRELDRLDKGSK